MKTIIAPTDFSPVSYNACIYAAHMAQDIKAELVLLHLMELPLAVAEFPVTEDVFDEISVEAELKELQANLRTETNNNVKIEIKNILGSAEYEIKELCKVKTPVAVVMGTHSSSILDRFFLGSATVYTVKHLHYPVIVVPADAKYKSIKKIALASDLQNIYKIPVQEMETIVNLFKAEFEIVFVAKNKNDINKNSVQSLILDHRLVNLNPQFHFIENKDVLQGVTSIAKQHNIDLLIIIPKNHGPFHKSQSKDFIFYSPIPLMAIHEHDVEVQV